MLEEHLQAFKKNARHTGERFHEDARALPRFYCNRILQNIQNMIELMDRNDDLSVVFYTYPRHNAHNFGVLSVSLNGKEVRVGRRTVRKPKQRIMKLTGCNLPGDICGILAEEGIDGAPFWEMKHGKPFDKKALNGLCETVANKVHLVLLKRIEYNLAQERPAPK
ncbi:MAG: hypothetical protein P4M13_05745 [Alphaproteobacteria bacterium]|nr:hypothetical protein [Alphaproteobacteria bacterium]